MRNCACWDLLFEFEQSFDEHFERNRKEISKTHGDDVFDSRFGKNSWKFVSEHVDNHKNSGTAIVECVFHFSVSI